MHDRPRVCLFAWHAFDRFLPGRNQGKQRFVYHNKKKSGLSNKDNTTTTGMANKIGPEVVLDGFRQNEASFCAREFT